MSESQPDERTADEEEKIRTTELVDEGTSGMIEIAPVDADINLGSKASLLTSKQLKKEKIDDEDGEILPEIHGRMEKAVGMAIKTVLSDKSQGQDDVKVKVEPNEMENPGQVIQSIVTTRGKPIIEQIVGIVKIMDHGNKEQSPCQPRSDEIADKLKKAQTEEALKLLEQFKGIDTKNEEAIKMIEKFRSVDKELKTLDLDKPRSKKESWEKESYKDRYEDSRYRESSKYKDKDYGRYSKDGDYDRYDDRSKSYDKRRDKYWDKRRRDSQERYDSRDRDRQDKKRHKKDRYYDRRERSFSRDRSHSRSPERGRNRSHGHSRSRSRERSKRHSRDSRSRSRERSRRNKRSRPEKRRYSSDDSDDSRSSMSRSFKKEKESYLDSSKGEVDKLTEEWIRMATEKPKKSKIPTTTAASGSSVVTLTATNATASPQPSSAAPTYYQDAYGNYYPVTSTSQSYPNYQQAVPQQGPLMPPPPSQSIPGMVPTNQTMPPQGMLPPTQPVHPHSMAPPPLAASHGMPPPGQMMPPQGMPPQNQAVPPYQQTNPAVYGPPPVYGQPTQDQMYMTDPLTYSHHTQGPPGPPQSALLPTPPTMQFAPPQNPAVNPGQFQPPSILPGQEFAHQGLVQTQRPPLIGESPAEVITDSVVNPAFTSNLQGQRLPFPMPTQQNVPMFKTAEQKQVVAQQPKPTASPQDVSQSPTAGLLPDSRGNTSSPVIVTSSSKEYQLPELPYQNEGETTLALRSDITTGEPNMEGTANNKPVEVKPISKPLMALKGFKIKQKGLSLLMPTDNVVSSSFQSDGEEKSKKPIEIVTPESSNGTPPPVADVPKHPPPSSQTGLPIKLGMKQDKRDADLASPPPSASPRPEKVKSRWRRLSDFETPIAQSPDSNVSEIPVAVTSDIEASPTKEPADIAQPTKGKESVVYDAWDPASDIVFTPEAMKTQTAMRAARKESTSSVKREKKVKEPESPLKTDKPKEIDSSLKTEKLKESEEEKDPNKIPHFEPLDENLYLSEK